MTVTRTSKEVQHRRTDVAGHAAEVLLADALLNNTGADVGKEVGTLESNGELSSTCEDFRLIERQACHRRFSATERVDIQSARCQQRWSVAVTGRIVATQMRRPYSGLGRCAGSTPHDNTCLLGATRARRSGELAGKDAAVFVLDVEAARRGIARKR
ncbi:hypothetical protein BCCGELA001_29590 [Bradyrhizobium sp. CCGE-LA001]|nr:hypothetical protein BCCGELA001_29590 [Bradyrhizobium sp. CCGE-LA001]